MNGRFFNTALLHATAGRKALWLFTAYVFGLWTFKMFVDPVHELANLPRGMVEPVGVLQLLPAGWLSALLSVTGLWLLRTAAVAGCALSMIPRLIQWAGPLACIALTLHQSLVRSFGIVQHSEIALLMAAYVLVLFAWYRWLGVGHSKKEFNPHAIPLFTIALILTVAYALVGTNRLIKGGLHVFTSDTLPNYILSRSLATKYFEFGIGESVAEWPAVVLIGAKVGFFVTTIIEATAPLCLLSRYYRYLFLAVMIPFHIVTLLTMQISFHENLLLYLVLIDFSRWIPDKNQVVDLSAWLEASSA